MSNILNSKKAKAVNFFSCPICGAVICVDLRDRYKEAQSLKLKCVFCNHIDYIDSFENLKTSFYETN